MSESDTKPILSKLMLGLLVMAVVIVAGLFFFPQGDGEVGPEIPTESIDSARVARLMNVGIAHLENNELSEAESIFSELVEVLPDEQSVRQNLAVTLLLKIAPENLNRADNPDRFNAEFAQASQAVAELKQRFPEKPQTHVLASRLDQRVDNHAQAIASLRKAAELNPDDASIWFSIFDIGRYSRDDELMAEADRALARAWELAPDNLFVMREWLTSQARSRDPGVSETLAAARELVAPFVDRIHKFGRVDLHDLLDKAAAALEEENWGTVTRNVSITGNMLRPEVATQNDARKVTPHLLEFIVHDFSQEFYSSHTLPDPELPKAIPVSFTLPETPLHKIKGARQVHFADFDLNQTQDIVVVLEDQISVWTQSGPELSSWNENVTFRMSENSLPSSLSGICLFDLDRDAAVVEHSSGDPTLLCADADLDILAFGKDGLVVLRNELLNDGDRSGKRILERVDQNDDFDAVTGVRTALPVDFDHDGDLDLVVSTESGVSLWLNRDDSTFDESTAHSVLPPDTAGIHTLIAVDWDRNVSIDVLAFGDRQSGVLKNILHGQLRWEPFPEGSGLSDSIESAVLLESDGNFSWDLVATSTGDSDRSITKLFRTTNPDSGVVNFLQPKDLPSGLDHASQIMDYDNDGYFDVAGWVGSTVNVLRGGADGTFQAGDGAEATLPSGIVSLATGDIDGDGDIDLGAVCDESVHIVINEGGNANHWIDIPIRAEDAKQAQKPNERVNIHGVGSLLELRSGAGYQPQVVTGRSTHFGLGQQQHVDSARVLWTNGIPEHIVQPRHGEPICLQQHLKGSCPYLYTWDGEKFVFYTDCLWAAPIGLQLAEGVLAPPREWEYLKIDGDCLKARKGEYVLKLTEELWEIGYFDSVKLLAIDHPAEVDIYSNEKVGPPSISQFKVHTVQNPRTPISAVDQNGRDVLPEVKARDEDFAQCFDRRVKQGLTEPHFLELDLGQLDEPQEITLFLTGWIRPTDTSLNVAISQRPDLESTQPPSVHVPNADGEWVEVRPYMGFPGGKTKTIAIDLSNVFPTNDYRVRIATTMELYWDHAFFTVDEEPVEFRTTEMPLLSADLHYRGFSKQVVSAGLGPATCDYQQLDSQKQWPPMEGHLTTYGDVTELIAQTDNRQALLGAGDEMEVRFQAISTELPVGWKREFILHNVGWDKDADLNTVFGQSVDPLPFAGMIGYPDPSGPADQQKPYAAQTRRQPRAPFWRASSIRPSGYADGPQ